MTETITLTGRVGTAPIQRTLPSGIVVTTFRVGSTRRRQDPQSGQWRDAGTSWYTVSAYRRLADGVAASVRVGDPVVVTGRLRITDWANDTTKGTAVDIDADAVGHDLTWGTATFVRPDRADADAAVGGTSAEAWASPGVEAQAAGSWATTPVPDAPAAMFDGERAAASAGAPADTDGPF